MDRSAKSLIALVISGLIFGLGVLITNFPVNDSLPKPQQINKKVTESTSSAIAGITGEEVLVKKVVDGDTVELEDGRRVRYIGVDTPETKDPRRPVGCYGKQAAQENKNLVEGKKVILQKDISDTDKYDRLLRYVYLPLEAENMLFVNDYLVRNGYAKASTYPPDVKYSKQFLEAEKYARENNLGLWGKCDTLK